MEAPITFVKTRYHYDSYTDFWRLVELSDFPTMYVDDLRPSMPGVFITTPMNGEWRPHMDNWDYEPRNAHLILWNIERPSGSAGAVGKYGELNRELIYQRYVDEVWVSDRRLAQETTLRFVVLGSDEELGEMGLEKRYDFCHLSYEVPRRQTIYKEFSPRRIGPNCWGEERHEMLKLSHFALNVHQDDHPFQEPLRFALFAAYGLPIVSETIYDAYPWGEETMVFSGYDGLVGKMCQVLENDYGRWREMGMRARAMMCHEFRFRDVVEQAVQQSVGSWR